MTALLSMVLGAFILLLIALYFVLQAIWELRKGENGKGFIIKGMIGVGLIVLVLVAPYLYSIGLGLRAFHSMTSPGITLQGSSSSSTIPLNNMP